MIQNEMYITGNDKRRSISFGNKGYCTLKEMVIIFTKM